jgi:NADPH:quinone reductase-like Zn-dependent oxidoreductase
MVQQGKSTMKALVQRQYGSPEFLDLKEIPKPVPRQNEMLIKIHATSINDWDWGLLNASPFFPNRLMAGVFKPTITLGSDIAGRVESIGSSVTRFKPGDAVYGDLSGCGFGGFAEFVCVPETAVMPMSPRMTFEQAAAIPQAGMLALQGLQAGAALNSGHSILVNGAGGGVGTIAIQLAKLHDVHATGVDSASKLDTMRSLGYDHVIDYRLADFTHSDQHYDLILDAKTDRSPADYERVLKPNGVYATVGGSMPKLLQIAFSGLRIRRTSQKKLRVVGLKPNRDLAYFNQLFETGKFTPVIDGAYKFTETDVRAAFAYFGAAQHKGKLVVTIARADA